uniref:Uncharacterized protein n=1 Tax=Tanacetum cinerariifolium TaxID=118510 RepID=A0A699L9Z0_TANCI|nr:hypothetical protein [Tanacetum cinerariifolium]
MDQNVDFSGSDQIQTPTYTQPEDSNELIQKLLEDLQIINKELKCNHPTFSDNNEDHSVQHKENLENSLNSNQEKEKPPQDSDIRQLIREECCIEVYDKQKQNMENTIPELVEDIEYVEASLPDPEIISVEEVNDVNVEEEEVNLEDVFQIQDVVLREKLLSINRLICNIESLNDNPTPNRVLNSSVSFPISEEFDNSLSDNSSPEFKTFCDHTKETRSGNTTTHANDSLPEYDSFCFEIKPDQERLINVSRKFSEVLVIKCSRALYNLRDLI